MKYSQAGNGCQPRLRSAVDKLRAHASRLLWPATCVLCKQAGELARDLCQPCEADLPANSSACELCAEPLPSSAAALLCGACLRHPPPFAASYAPFRYAYPLDHLIRGLKFRGDLACGRVLGELFARRLLDERAGALPELIVPVPLAPRRYRERGYNQAAELALSMSRLTGVPISTDAVVRRRETLEQTALDRKDRRRNVRGAFAIAARMSARHVAILDDVITTGSTARELAKVLLRAGAVRVEAWAIAKAGHHLNTYSSAIPMKTAMP